MVVAEIKYSVCPCPFKRPREARQERDWYGTGMEQVRDRKVTGMGRVRDGTGSSTIKVIKESYINQLKKVPKYCKINVIKESSINQN